MNKLRVWCGRMISVSITLGEATDQTCCWFK